MKLNTLFPLMLSLLILPISFVYAQEVGHIHHVHLNVGQIEKTRAFYQQHFGVVPVDYNNSAPALMLERSFLLMEEVPRDEIKNHQLTGLTHISWSAVDAPSVYERLREQDVEFYQPLTPLVQDSYYMYLYGPDREVIEIFDLQRHHRFNHIHQLAEDPEETAQWYLDLVNQNAPVTRQEDMVNLTLDTLAFSIFSIGARFTPKENTGSLEHTDGSHLDHIAFSFRDLDAAYQRAIDMGATIERPISVDEKYGFRHFFTRAPNGVLVELLEARSWPEAAWE